MLHVKKPWAEARPCYAEETDFCESRKDVFTGVENLEKLVETTGISARIVVWRLDSCNYVLG